MILLANNNASSTLAGPIGPSATSLAVQSGAGALFPSPGANQYFTITLNDAATGLQKEIMWCTNVTGDTFTVIRAQEGTAAQSWLANDLVDNFWTAGSMAAMAQQGQLQSFTPNQAPDTGSVNALVASLTPAPANLAAIAGAPIIVTGVVASNTGNTTLNLNGFGAQPIKNANGTQLSPGEVTIGSSVLLTWSAGTSSFQLLSTSLASEPPVPYINAVPGAYSATIPPGMTRAKLTIVGGGGGGGGCDGTHNAGGGQAGGILVKWLSGLVPGQSIAGSIGVGGTAGTPGTTGGTGGSSTAQVNGTGTVYTANGGAGGVGGTTSPFGGFGDGTLTGGDEEYIGSAGSDGNATNVSAPAGNGGSGYLGAGAGKGSAGGGSGANAASATGAGGGGSYLSSSTGGSGGAGLVLLYWSP